jgi:hypothetical protein
VTHPVNQFWVEGQNLNRLGPDFSHLAQKRLALRTSRRAPDWKQLRDRWEYSHVARAVLMLASIAALLIALSSRS